MEGTLLELLRYLSLVLLLLLFLALVLTINCLKTATSHSCLSLSPTIALFSASLSDYSPLTSLLCLHHCCLVVFNLSCTASPPWFSPFFFFFFFFSGQTAGFSSVALLQLYTSPHGLHSQFPFLFLPSHFIFGLILFFPLF